MGSISRLIRNVKGLNLDEVFEESFSEKQRPLVLLQRDQMLHGERSDGKKIGKYRNKKYAQKKYAQNSLAGFGYIDLRLTGDFQGDILADVRNKSVVFTSADEKTSKLIEDFGEKIFGLNEPYRKKFSAKELKPTALKKILKQILK